MTAKQYQEQLLNRIGVKFPDLEIKNEWAAFTGQIHQYSPRVDIAIGPFNVPGPGPNLAGTYNELVGTLPVRNFVEEALNFHLENVGEDVYLEIPVPNLNTILTKNENSRCLIAIEIENTNSKKHMMGSIVNAASLGRIGIGVAYCESAKRTFLRIVNYLNFLKRAEKNTYDTSNFLILTTEQMNQLVETGG